ncbi:MAG: M56 family metallopeptidase [Vicinamibacterales bacterium]
MRTMLADGALVLGGSFAVALLVKATVTLAVALLAYRLARRSRAAARHVLLTAAFAVLLFLPFAASVIPSRVVEVTAATVVRATPAAIVPHMPDTVLDRMAATGSVEEQSASFRPSTVRLLALAWGVGALVLFVPLLAGMWQTRLLGRTGTPSPRGIALAQTLSRSSARRPVDVLLHVSVSGPMTCGIVHPTILLPLDVDTWSDDELRQALIHELEHVRRGDWATQCLARAVCAAYWFHPLVWMAWNRLRLEAERACDDAVVQDADSTAYATQLVGLAERLSTGTQPLLAIAARRDLSTRVRAVLDAAQKRGRAGTVCVATAVVAAAVLVTTVAPLRAVPRAQTPAAGTQDPPLAFETASIKPNKSGADEQYIQRTPGGSLRVVNYPLRQLIVFAYQIQGFQLEGAPDWSSSERFDIEARPEKDLPVVALAADRIRSRLMLRKLLADRFRLVVHKETKELPIFELVLARPDGRLGPQLRRSTTDCSAPKPPPAGPGGCGTTGNVGRIRFGGFPLSEFANMLSQSMQRVVVDRTGLTGNWDFELTFTPDQSQLPQGTSPGQLPDVDPNAPSLVTAMEEQLGLRLRPARGPVEVLVVERVERPTEN